MNLAVGKSGLFATSAAWHWYRSFSAIMASSSGDGIVDDKSGIPHLTGAMPGLIMQYRRRVRCVSTLKGESAVTEPRSERLCKTFSQWATC